jgi:hypothetical protein
VAAVAAVALVLLVALEQTAMQVRLAALVETVL